MRSAVAGDACLSNNGPVWIGMYNSSLLRENDLALFHGRMHYATITDDNGNLWLFVAPTPGERGSPLEPLRQFGFLVV